MKKRFSAILLALGMLCSLAPIHANAEDEPIEQVYGDFTYVNCDDHIEIRGFSSLFREEYAFQTVEIPTEIDGLPVTSIGKGAFRGEQFSSVILPNTLTSIQSGGFSNCSNLSRIEFPNGLTTIEASAFFNCPNLTEITFPDSLTSIGNRAFGSSGLKEVHIPETILEFGDDIFFHCLDLEIATLPENMTVIPNGIFQQCRSLKHIDLPEHTKIIGDSAFSTCVSLEDIVIPDGVTTLKTLCFSSCASFEEVMIPESVTEIGESVFMNCLNLKRVTFPENTKEIGFWMFTFSGIEEITFSENIETINCSLTWCKNLKSVTFLNPDCEIFDSQMSIFNEYSHLQNEEIYDFGGIIYGYEDSTAQAYAQKYGYTFCKIGETLVSDTAGDITGDGRLSLVDLIHVRKSMLSRDALPKICDMNGDNVVNVIDLALMKQALLQ